MSIHDNNGTAFSDVGKLYLFDGVAFNQIGKTYVNDGTSNCLIYTAETILPALNALSVNTAGANETVYSEYVSCEPVDCSSGDTISFTAFIHTHANNGGEHGTCGAICLQLIKRVGDIDIAVYSADYLNMYGDMQGFASCMVFAAGSDNYAKKDFSYVIPDNGKGAYYVKIRSAIQRAASELSPIAYAQAYTSEISFK